MSDLILHHYAASAYSEKIRAILGFKRLAWHSVTAPDVMPKHDLVALTGGYRLLPVLQQGAHVFCDSHCIARQLDRCCPQPALHAGDDAAAERALVLWGESIFQPLVMLALAGGAFSAEFIADRKQMIGDGFDPGRARPYAAARLEQLRSHLGALQRQLHDGRRYLQGEACGIADFSVYHPLWSLARVNLARELDPFPTVHAWMERIAAFGHGVVTEISSSHALAQAQALGASRWRLPKCSPGESWPAIGSRIRIRHEVYGRETVTGEVVWTDAHDVAVSVSNEQAGEVFVYFPREGTVMREVAGD